MRYPEHRRGLAVAGLATVVVAAAVIYITLNVFCLIAQSPIKLSELCECDESKARCVRVFILSLRYRRPRRRATLCYAAVRTCGTEGANWIGITVCKPGLNILMSAYKQIGLVACKSEAV